MFVFSVGGETSSAATPPCCSLLSSMIWSVIMVVKCLSLLFGGGVVWVDRSQRLSLGWGETRGKGTLVFSNVLCIVPTK